MTIVGPTIFSFRVVVVAKVNHTLSRCSLSLSETNWHAPSTHAPMHQHHASSTYAPMHPCTMHPAPMHPCTQHPCTHAPCTQHICTHAPSTHAPWDKVQCFDYTWCSRSYIYPYIVCSAGIFVYCVLYSQNYNYNYKFVIVLHSIVLYVLFIV